MNFCAAYFEPQLSISLSLSTIRIQSDRLGSAHLVALALPLPLPLTLTLALRCDAELDSARLQRQRRDNEPIHYCACLASFAAHFIKIAFKTIIQALKLYLHSLQSLFNLLLRFDVAPLPSTTPSSTPLHSCFICCCFCVCVHGGCAPKRVQALLRFMISKALVVVLQKGESLVL